MLIGWLGLALVSAGTAAEKMRVKSANVNVRSGPGTRYEIVCQAGAGELVVVRRTTDEWSEIDPPAGAKLWVYAELIEESAVVTRVQVRSGPGISYRPVGKLEQGQTVTIHETVGEWARIAPPREASVWISSQFLESPNAPPAPIKPVVSAPKPPPPPKPVVTPVVIPRKPVRATPPKPAPAPQSVRSRPSSPAPAPVVEREKPVAASDPDLPAALVGRELAIGKPQGEVVELSGEIRSSGFSWGKLGPYRLVGKGARGRTVTICYVLGNSKQLASILGRRVSIKGRQYWVRRVRYPGVRPDRIRVQR
jgi:uncharacterized protein YraI